ncbi:MAG: MBL fold metallo-hydrolase [Acidimicrobiia bacterium]|nr:MBL fold metallo-hydrolase [Acidimicrobiia bacterium]
MPKQEQETASEEVVEVAPGVLRMQLPIWMPGLGHVNMYGLVDDRGLAVVDPGMPGPKSWRAVKARLRSAGYRVGDVHTVLVTHSHPDHFGCAGRLRKEAGAEVVAHRAFTTWTMDPRAAVSEAEAERVEEAAIRAAEGYRGPSADEAPSLAGGPGAPGDDDHGDDMEGRRRLAPWGGPTPWGGHHPAPALVHRMAYRAMRLLFSPPDPTRRVVHGASLRLAGRDWFAVHTPGHTLDHLCLWDPEGGVLLSGDHVLPTITPHIAGSPHGDSLHAYLVTLDLVASLDGVELGLPAHGHPFTDVPGRVEAIKEHHRERVEELRRASLALGPTGVQELSREVFPRRHWGVMAESETFSHLAHLRRAGEAERWEEGGRLVYRATPG